MRGSECIFSRPCSFGEMKDKPLSYLGALKKKKRMSADSITALRKAHDVVGNRRSGLKTAAGIDGYLENQTIKLAAQT